MHISSMKIEDNGIISVCVKCMAGGRSYAIEIEPAKSTVRMVSSDASEDALRKIGSLFSDMIVKRK